MTVVTRSRAGRATDRDLRSARAATLKPRAGKATDRDLRSARALTLKPKRKKVATALVGARIQKRKRPASASERAEVPKKAAAAAAAGKTLAEASFILKLKKEAFGAEDLWEHRHAPVGALERWLKAKEKEAKAEEAQPKKKKMVVKTRLSRDFIDVLRRQQPGLIKDVPDKFFDGQPESIRHRHAMLKYIHMKRYAYHKALIDQYINQRYAEDEDEVTTDGEQD